MARDPHLRARSADRDATISAIQAAYAQGLIGDADRTLRVENARRASTLGELDLLTRDFVADTPPPTGGPTPLPTGGPWPTYSPPGQPPPPNASLPYAGGAPRKPASSAKAGGIVAAAIFVVVFGASGLITNFGVDRHDYGIDNIEFDEGPFADEPFGQEPGFVEDPAADEYSLDPPGLDAFIGRLEAELGTTVVLRAVFYGDYVNVDLPTDDGKARHVTWTYRDGVFTQVGTPRANTPRDQTVDLRELDVEALRISLDKAVHTLGVDAPDTTYAIVSHTWAEPQATVAVHVANEFAESGYLATDLAGVELRRHPFQAP